MAQASSESNIEEARKLWAKIDEDPQELELKTIEHIMKLNKFDSVATVFLQESLKAARASATRKATLEQKLLSPRGPITPERVRRIVTPNSSAIAKPLRAEFYGGIALDTEFECSNVDSQDTKDLMTVARAAVCAKTEVEREITKESKLKTEVDVRRRLTRKVKIEPLVPSAVASRTVLRRPASAELQVHQRSPAVSEDKIRNQVSQLQRKISESTTLDQINVLEMQLGQLELMHFPPLRVLPTKLEFDLKGAGAEASPAPGGGRRVAAVTRGRPRQPTDTKPGMTRMRPASTKDKVLKRPGKVTRVPPATATSHRGLAKRPSRASRSNVH
eukprot:CAMPEP_0194521816 /NCGR_PEP_ID=MMETSP0253-20130528/56234_1 /TAXON_ID=2966 /ORGANISM="Noctiluca scintillans" /LENGTH=330 /DNA_ID=CAMNT_0039366199 /DNA_START=25 /DNA_END=1017 /DNA_ORIENTATION=+